MIDYHDHATNVHRFFAASVYWGFVVRERKKMSLATFGDYDNLYWKFRCNLFNFIKNCVSEKEREEEAKRGGEGKREREREWNGKRATANSDIKKLLMCTIKCI